MPSQQDYTGVGLSWALELGSSSRDVGSGVLPLSMSAPRGLSREGETAFPPLLPLSLTLAEPSPHTVWLKPAEVALELLSPCTGQQESSNSRQGVGGGREEGMCL